MAEELNTQSEDKIYTQEEVNELLQREGDRRVTEALKKAQKKFDESQRLSQMDANEKYEYQLKQREEAIAEKEKQLALAEMKNEAAKIMVEKGLSLDLVDIILDTDAELVKTRISALEKAFKESVKKEVENRMGGKAPEQSKSADKAISREDFNKMSLAEQLRMYHEQPELYAALTK